MKNQDYKWQKQHRVSGYNNNVTFHFLPQLLTVRRNARFRGLFGPEIPWYLMLTNSLTSPKSLNCLKSFVGPRILLEDIGSFVGLFWTCLTSVSKSGYLADSLSVSHRPMTDSFSHLCFKQNRLNRQSFLNSSQWQIQDF